MHALWWTFLSSGWNFREMILQINDRQYKNNNTLAYGHEQHAFQPAIIWVMKERQSREDSCRTWASPTLQFPIATQAILPDLGKRNPHYLLTNARLCFVLASLCSPPPLSSNSIWNPYRPWILNPPASAAKCWDCRCTAVCLSVLCSSNVLR